MLSSPSTTLGSPHSKCCSSWVSSFWWALFSAEQIITTLPRNDPCKRTFAPGLLYVRTFTKDAGPLTGPHRDTHTSFAGLSPASRPSCRFGCGQDLACLLFSSRFMSAFGVFTGLCLQPRHGNPFSCLARLRPMKRHAVRWSA